jgi:2-C-methyl-D-erythritol 4-phosphate cytidylyltransferase
VLAGGSGTRVGAGRNKVYLPLGGRTVLGWSLRAFAGHPAIGPVVLVARAEDEALAKLELGSLGACGDALDVEIVTGGATRQGSELAGLRHLAARIAAEEIDTVLIHDGARPLVSAELISAVLRAARADGGAVPGLRRDDLAAATPDGTGLQWAAAAAGLVAVPGLPLDDLAAAAPDGTGLHSAAAAAGLVTVQTPQGFRAAPLLAAYEQAHRQGFVGTDTASCMQHFSALPVRWVPGEERNFKITYAHDLVMAEHAVARRLCRPSPDETINRP